MDTSMTKKVKFPIAAVFAFVYAVLYFYFNSYVIIHYDTINGLIHLCPYVLVGVMLLRKKNDVFLCGSIAIFVLSSFLKFIFYSPATMARNFIEFIAVILLLFIALSNCADNRIKAYFENYSVVSKKIWFIPMSVKILGCIIDIYELHNFKVLYGDVYFHYVEFIYIVLDILFFAFAALWLINPYSADEQKSPESVSDTSPSVECGAENCGMIKHILLLLFTFGIWNYIWIYRTTKFLNNTPGVKYNSPTSKLLLCMFVPFYQIYWLYSQGQRIDTFSKSKRINNTDIATVCLLLGFFMPNIAFVLMQDRINAICMTSASYSAASKAPEINYDEIKKYKELLDSGIITIEEFEAKKKQILGL